MGLAKADGHYRFFCFFGNGDAGVMALFRGFLYGWRGCGFSLLRLRQMF
ncbi:MAG: hypothetical protein ACFN9G_09965 [Cardiobacterium sp.]|jgi:hypothetical protein